MIKPRHFLAALVLITASIAIVTIPMAAYAQIVQGKLADGYVVEKIISGLTLPTHLAYGPDGALYVTQLNGGEDLGQGQVVRIEKPGAAPQPVLEKLLKPTGLAFAGNDLYIVAKNTLLVSTLSDGKFSEPKPVFGDNLPFNGRSNGQIFLGPDGLLYFQSTGNETIPRDSGFIYTLKPGTIEKKIDARGFKNAYSMTWNPANGTMYATEIGDGDITGFGQPPEELNVIKRGGDYGWPQCYADQKENAAWGGNRNICADTDVPLAVFDPQNTPTAIAYFDDQVIVGLWNGQPPRLVSVDPKFGAVKDWATNFVQPIALLVDKDSALLVLDFGDGSISRITKSN